MITWIIVISLIVIGLALLIIELIFVPGTTVVGIIGLVCTVAGIWVSFKHFGAPVGWTVTSLSAVVAGGLFVYSFRAGAWKKFALHATIDSKVNQDRPLLVDVGSEGIALSALRPIGKAEFDGSEMEVRTLGDFVTTHSALRVIKIEGRKVIVEPIN